MTSNQEHLDQVVQDLQASFAQVVQELKAQASAGQPLDFTKADALVASVQSEATADAPPAPSPAPADPAPSEPAPAEQPAQPQVGGLA